MKRFFIRPLAAISGFLALLSSVIAAPAWAAGTLTLGSAPAISLTPQGAVDMMCSVVNWLFYILIVFSVIMVLIAGFRYLTANGDPEKVSKATKTITYAAIAIVVALIAKGFPTLIGSFFQVNVTSCT